MSVSFLYYIGVMAARKQSPILVLALMLILAQMEATVFAEESQEMAKDSDVLNKLRLVFKLNRHLAKLFM